MFKLALSFICILTQMTCLYVFWPLWFLLSCLDHLGLAYRESNQPVGLPCIFLRFFLNRAVTVRILIVAFSDPHLGCVAIFHLLNWTLFSWLSGHAVWSTSALWFVSGFSARVSCCCLGSGGQEFWKASHASSVADRLNLSPMQV